MHYKFKFDEKKNLKLKRERGISFDEVINAINDEKVLDIIPHYNKQEYSHQLILIVEIKSYVYLVPYLEQEDCLILKTVFPRRKFTKLYLGGR